MSVAYIIGAGISGLAAATRLAEAGVHVRVYEATPTAGGRAATRRDAQLGDVDTGLHSVRTGDTALLRYLTRIGARESWSTTSPLLALPFAPMLDYAWALRQLFLTSKTAETLASPLSPLANEWVAPFARAWLGQSEVTLPTSAFTRALWQHILPGNNAWLRPEQHLSQSLVAPALDYLDYHGSSIYFSHALKQVTHSADEPATLHFTRKKLQLMPEDVVILATPAATTAKLVPGIEVPDAGSPSITCHFEVEHREPRSTRALIDAPADLADYRHGRISLSCRVADSHWHSAPESYASQLWRWLQKAHPYLRGVALPPYAIVREKQASHRVTATRLPAPTLPPRVFLAGDWLDATRPSSLNQAAAHGHAAAEAAIQLLNTTKNHSQSKPYHFFT